MGKGSKRRSVPVGSKALEAMRSHLDSSRSTMLSSIGTREKLTQP